ERPRRRHRDPRGPSARLLGGRRLEGRSDRPGEARLMMHRGSILLVDDEEKILKALGRALRDAGHGVVETTSPRHAQRLLAERAFDVLVVDNVMPELNGLELIREFVGSTHENERPQI